MTTKYLHKTLKQEMNPTLGFSHVGRLSADDVKKIANGFNIADHGAMLWHSDGWKPEARDFEHLPQSCEMMAETSAINWHNPNSYFDFALLEPLIPGISAVERLKVGQMICDYVGIHQDTHLHDCTEAGVLCILLDAPKGCKMLTGGQHVTEVQKGDVFFVDDSLEHAVYPLKATALYKKSEYGKDDEAAIEFGINNCMKFLLITRTRE